jgi:hypothetical protein
VDAALPAVLQQEPRHFLDEKRHTTGAFSYTVNQFLRQRVAGRKLFNHVPYLLAVERRQGDQGVM